MKKVAIFIIVIFLHMPAFCQSFDFSTPEKLGSSNIHLDILGKYPDGILVLEHSHNTDFLETYYDDMTLHWRRPLVLKDKNTDLQRVLILGDTVTAVYLEFVKSVTLLKISRLNNLMLEARSTIIDTLATTTTSPLPIIRFTSSSDHKLFLIFTTPDNFYEKRKVQFYLFDNKGSLVMRKSSTIGSELAEPSLIDATIDAQGNIICLLGERAMHSSQRENYNFDKLTVSIFKNGSGLMELPISEEKEFYGRPAMGFDIDKHRLILTGFYAHAPGETGDGTFYYNVSIDSQLISKRQLEKFSDDFLSLVTGDIPLKKDDGFDNFQIMDAVVKKDGGTILMAESQFQTNESVANPMYGPFGIASSVTITYYHYDDIVLFSFDAMGNIEWRKVLHKRQETEGDNGYFSSYSMLISNQLDFIYNDNTSGQNNVASYSIKPTGEMVRADLFNSDQKGVQLIPKYGKQVSAHELVIPSVKRNFVQFVKFTF